jgi:hypothetical protein
VPFGDAPGDVLDALDRAHRSAAVFMYDECHCRFEQEEKPRCAPCNAPRIARVSRIASEVSLGR